MKYLDVTFAQPARNLACDEALLNWFEAQRPDDGLLRLWQPENYFVVLGHSNHWAAEVAASMCAADGVPILRRVSGGGTVLQGQGCLNYSLILDCEISELQNIESTFRYVLNRHGRLIAALTGLKIAVEGISDLTVSGRKFSGNAQYRKARYALVHGTFLLNFDLVQIERYLRMPMKQPDYRQNRPHSDFVTNLPIDVDRLCEALRDEWQARALLEVVPLDKIEGLVDERYGRPEWSNKF
ncbi:MAG: lplA [Deltaproteobacteria bacterium]|nr:lplA [Deltaproteobacteria bacterium]